MVSNQRLKDYTVQGDPAPCFKPHIDINLKVAFKYKVLELKRSFKSMSTGGLERGAGSPCIKNGIWELAKQSPNPIVTESDKHCTICDFWNPLNR